MQSTRVRGSSEFVVLLRFLWRWPFGSRGRLDALPYFNCGTAALGRIGDWNRQGAGKFPHARRFRRPAEWNSAIDRRPELHK
jgi:hypothetical protein